MSICLPFTDMNMIFKKLKSNSIQFDDLPLVSHSVSWCWDLENGIEMRERDSDSDDNAIGATAI